MVKASIVYEKQSKRFGYILEFNEHLQIIQGSRKQLWCYGYDENEIAVSLEKIYECGTGSGILYGQIKDGEPIKLEYIDGIKVGKILWGDFPRGGDFDSEIDEDYGIFMAKRFQRIISINIYEKEESS